MLESKKEREVKGESLWALLIPYIGCGICGYGHSLSAVIVGVEKGEVDG